MADVTKDIIQILPKWVITVAFCVLLVFMVISLFSGTTFKIGGLEFGFSQKPKEPAGEESFYTVVGSVETSDKKPPHEIVISPRYPPVNPTSEGKISGLEVWKDPKGKFPILYFFHESYLPVAVDLNDKDQVILFQDGKDMKLQVKKTIIMHRKGES